jgi:histidine phosphotransferase ChpT
VSAPDLAELVGTRLCHDLISPMGAIGNGLELLALGGGPAGAEIALVNDSLAAALARLRFFRVAFGPAEAQARQSLEEAAQITGGMFNGRFTVVWNGDDREMPRSVARLAYLAILCLEKSLPMGGSCASSIPRTP